MVEDSVEEVDSMVAAGRVAAGMVPDSSVHPSRRKSP